MGGFAFDAVPSIVCEAGALTRIGALTAARLGRKGLLVTDRGLAAGWHGVRCGREPGGRRRGAGALSAVTADPAASIVRAAGYLARETGRMR